LPAKRLFRVESPRFLMIQGNWAKEFTEVFITAGIDLGACHLQGQLWPPLDSPERTVGIDLKALSQLPMSYFYAPAHFRRTLSCSTLGNGVF